MIVCLAFFFSSCVFCFVFLRFRRVLPRLFQGPSSSDEPNVVRGRQPTRARFLFVSFLFCFLLAVEFSGIFRNERCRVTVFLSAFLVTSRTDFRSSFLPIILKIFCYFWFFVVVVVKRYWPVTEFYRVSSSFVTIGF